MKISILIPVFNTCDFLHKCITSVISQTYKDIEIIVVNDGSTDDSLTILKHYADIDNRIMIINQSNKGHQIARQVAIDAASGEYIYFIDSDDSLPNITVISDMVESIDHQIDMVVGRINIDNGKSKVVFPSSIFGTISSLEYLHYLLSGKVSWNIVGKLYHKTLLKDKLQIPLKVGAGEDALFIITLVSSANLMVKMIDIPVYNYYKRPNSITQSKDVKYIFENYKVAEYIQHLLSNKIESEYLVSFRLLLMLTSFRYGWIGAKHPLNESVIKAYKANKRAIRLLYPRKRLLIWLLIYFGDFISKYICKNKVNV